MRRIAATYVFPNHGDPIKNGILVCDNNGEIVEVIDRGGELTEEAGTEFYSGILVPGFICPTIKSLNFTPIEIRKLRAAGVVLSFNLKQSLGVAIDTTGDEYLNFSSTDNLSPEEGSEQNYLLQETIKPGGAFLEKLIGLQEKHSTLKELFDSVILNTARFLQLEKKYGSFETGKRPGVNLITGIDYKNMKLTEKSKLKRLI